MTDLGPVLAWVLFYVSIASLVLFVAGACRVSGEADDLAERMLDGDDHPRGVREP